jgi:hypothetical protein
MRRAIILLLWAAGQAAAFAQAPAWSLRESVEAGGRTALLFGVEGAASPSLRLDCSAAGTLLSVRTRAPGHSLGRNGGGPTFVSVFVGRREFRYGANLAQQANGDWVVEAPVRDPAEFLPAIRQVPRVAIVTHAGRELAPVPATDLIDRFDRACRAARPAGAA